MKQLPAFANETEEANWWYDNREQHAEEFLQAMQEGKVRRGSVMQRALAASGEIVRLSDEDAEAARALAEKTGQAVEVFLSHLLHDALQREARALVSLQTESVTP